MPVDISNEAPRLYKNSEHLLMRKFPQMSDKCPIAYQKCLVFTSLLNDMILDPRLEKSLNNFRMIHETRTADCNICLIGDALHLLSQPTTIPDVYLDN